MRIKAVFFDMDGTLLTDHRTISPSTIQAINELREKGILVGIATGRDPSFILPYMASLRLDVAVAYNGQYIFSREKVLYASSLAIEDIQEVLAYARKTHKDVSFGTAKGMVGSHIMSAGTSHVTYRLTRAVPASWSSMIDFILNRIVRLIRPQKEDRLQAVLSQPIYQMVLLAAQKENSTLLQQFDNLSVTRSSPYATDIISKGNSKLTGILKVAKDYGIDRDHILVFGDSENDLEMLQGLPYSIAMGNASDHVKEAAFLVTDTNNHDGIYKALCQLGLMEEDDDKQ